MRAMLLIGVLALAGCDGEPIRDSYGCPVMMTEVGRAVQTRCQADAMRDAAIREGRPVTECVQSGATQTCVTY